MHRPWQIIQGLGVEEKMHVELKVDGTRWKVWESS